MNRLIDRQPAVEAVEQEAADARERWRRYEALKRDLSAEFAAEAAAAQAARKEALDNGERPPAVPTLDPLISDEEHTRRLATRVAEERRLDEARVRAVAASGDAILTEARKLHTAGIEQARPLVEALAAVLPDIREAQEACAEVSVARQALSSTRSTVPPDRQAATLADLVEAVTRGRDLLPSDRPRVLVDRDQPAGRSLGVQGSNIRRTPATGWEPPLPPEPTRIARRGA